MIVEFETVRSSLEEQHYRDLEIELHGAASVPFQREKDYKTFMTIEMDRIVDWTAGTVWLNNEQFECVYVYDREGDITPNLLISYQDFKKLYETYKSINILNWSQV